MGFPFTATAPAANMAPSASRPLMQQNFNSTSTLLNVDHVTFNNATGGQHKQVTFVTTSSPSAPTGLTSIEYTGAGTSDPTTPQLFWKNANAPYALSLIKAYGVFTTTGATTTFSNQFNMNNSVVFGAVNTYTVTINSGVLSGATPAAVLATKSGNPVSYSISGNTITLPFLPGSGQIITLIVLQI